MDFGLVKNIKINVNFNGWEISSDGVMLLLREIDNKLGLTKEVNPNISSKAFTKL